MSEQKRDQLTSPKGVAKWITINTPDTKFKDEGEYRVQLLLKGKDADDLKAKIDEAIRQSISDAKANKDNAKHKSIKASQYTPYGEDIDKEGNKTGFTSFKFTAKASGVSKKTKKEWTFKPRVFDAKGNPMDISKTQVWGGSTVKVAFEIVPYGVRQYSPTMGVGVSLKLAAVQIIDLKTGTGKDAKAFGFGEEEGYTSAPFPATDAEAEAGQADEEF
jgi:hypothetical protein